MRLDTSKKGLYLLLAFSFIFLSAFSLPPAAIIQSQPVNNVPSPENPPNGEFLILEVPDADPLAGPAMVWDEEESEDPLIIPNEEITLDIPEGCNVVFDYEFEKIIFEKINDLRSKLGRPLLTLNPQLVQAARQHSINMACDNFFSHYNRDGENFDERIPKHGYDAFAMGENIYAGDEYSNSPLRCFGAWSWSDHHYYVMTHSAFIEIGIGYAYVEDSNLGGYFSADFGSPAED